MCSFRNCNILVVLENLNSLLGHHGFWNQTDLGLNPGSSTDYLLDSFITKMEIILVLYKVVKSIQ